MWLIFVSCFVFLALQKPHGTMLWASVTGLVLLGGFYVAKNVLRKSRNGKRQIVKWR